MTALVASAAPRLDPVSRAWLTQLRADGPVREAAIARLYALLLTEARYEVRRRTRGLAHPSGRDLDDLAVQAADDALVAILAKLEQFRGDARFTTWARRFAVLEVPGEIRRRCGHAQDIPADQEHWPLERAASDDPEHRLEVSELARTIGGLIAHELTPHQREVLLALAIEEIPARTLAAHLRSTPGALYKTAHDARRKLRAGLTPALGPSSRGPVVGYSQHACAKISLGGASPMTTDSLIDPGSSLGGLVAERPARAELFERLRLEYCCGGHQTLTQACAERGLDLDAVSAMLAALETENEPGTSVEHMDWRDVGAATLCAHIVTVHHDGLREAFPRLERLLSTVVRVHADTKPRLRDAQRLFTQIRAELEPHLVSEENELFPACISSEQTGTPVAERVLEQHESEHVELGHALAALRILCDDYDRQAALCNAHRTLLDALEAFEQDLHRHVHEENNILLPRARAVRAPAPAEPASCPSSLVFPTPSG